MKNKVLISVVSAIIVIVAIVVIAVVSDDKEVKKPTEEITTVAQTTLADDVTLPDLELPGDEDGETKKKDDKKDSDKDEDETNYWDNVQVIEDGGETEVLLDENGEKVTDEEGNFVYEEYPGQNDGWSPIVKPEDLE